MIQSTNFPLSTYSVEPYGGWEAVGKSVKELGLDGLELISDPDNLADDIPLSLVAGYHMTFYFAQDHKPNGLEASAGI